MVGAFNHELFTRRDDDAGALHRDLGRNETSPFVKLKGLFCDEAITA